MTHSDLVSKAVFWLKHAKQCNPVFGEKGSRNISEFPDAIGFTAHTTIIVECKVSMADLRADKKKPHRNDGGMGNLRYYLLTHELFEQCDGFEWCGWGVVTCGTCQNTKQYRGMDSSEFDSNLRAERDFLRSRILEIQRFGQ